MSTKIDPASAEVDVVGIGNALVDVLSHEEDSLVESLGMHKGAMNLIDEDRSEEIYEQTGPGVEISGGSAANTIVGVAAMGGRAEYLGKVKDDQLGHVFAHDISATGVIYEVPLATEGPSTGCCLIMVTPDAQRTMNTYLGASVHLGPDDVDRDRIARASVVYLEGYLFDPPEAQEAFRVAARYAHEAGRVVSMTLSDGFCVERHFDAFHSFISGDVDLLFANENELHALYPDLDFDSAVQKLRSTVDYAAVTRSEKGSLVFGPDELVEVPAHPVETLVDTTGAGDLYAAGFLHAFSRGASLEVCGTLGSMAASEVITHIGARPAVNLAEIAEPLLAR